MGGVPGVTWVKRKMLSTKSNTSWPSWSRKYSAMARPVNATRARAPGGSFIWPYTSAALEPGMGLPVALSTCNTQPREKKTDGVSFMSGC